MNIEINFKKISGWLLKLPVKLRRFAVLIFLLVSLGVYGYIIYQIGSLSTIEPSQERISERAGEIKELRIDKENIQKLEQLEDQNIAIQALFEEARNNPFQDN